MCSHDFKGMAPAIRRPRHAEFAAGRNGDCDYRRITDHTGLHGQDDGLQVVYFVRPGERNQAVGITEPAHCRREHDVPLACEIVRERHGGIAGFRTAVRMNNNDDRRGRGNAIRNVDAGVEVDLVRGGVRRVTRGGCRRPSSHRNQGIGGGECPSPSLGRNE